MKGRPGRNRISSPQCFPRLAGLRETQPGAWALVWDWEKGEGEKLLGKELGVVKEVGCLRQWPQGLACLHRSVTGGGRSSAPQLLNLT